MRPKLEEKSRARQLRRYGEPLKRIAADLGVSVGSVHLWTKDIELTPEQVAVNLRGPRGPQNPELVAARARSWRETTRERRRAHQEKGRRRARGAEGLHMAGCLLYWAEGTKNRNTVALTNSDLHLIRFFWRFLRDCFQLGPDDVSFRINAYTRDGLSIGRDRAALV